MTTYTCPECRRQLRTVQALEAGTTVQCPQCRAVFAAPAMEVEAPTTPASASVPPPPQPAAPRLVDEDWQRPRRRDPEPVSRRPRPGAPSSNTGMIVGFLVGGLLIVGLLIGLLVWATRSEARVGQLQGHWQLTRINGQPAVLPQTQEFHDDGTGFLHDDDGRVFSLHYRFMEDGDLEIELFDPRGAFHRRDLYRVEWLNRNELILVEVTGGISFHYRRR